MSNEVKNLISEIDKWVTKKGDAIKIVVLLSSKFNITTQDFINELKKARKEAVC